MDSNHLRHEFLNFFKSTGHLVRPGISLVPDDPTLLFTSAGMVPMKPYFLGNEEPPSRRIATIQKCFRTTDIENVGKTPRHLTFLEMLGNFSIGDYFKKEAISFAWEFLTKRLKIPKERLWVSVFRDDDEAYEIWKKEIGFPEEKLVRLDEKDNFWGPVGTTGIGPCGPCSEIHYDLGPELRPPARPGEDGPRLVEVWNLVFMEFNKNERGELEPLKQKNIDTGMGLERLAMVVQGQTTVFETDLFHPLIETVASMARIPENPEGEKQNFALRLIADHLRAITFLVSDGVVPTNEGRGYVLRRILRRAFRYSRYIGLDKPFLHKLVPEVVNVMGTAYPELAEKSPYIQKVVRAEEERFCETLEDGLNILEKLLNDLASKGEKVVPGKEAFRLSDTYGFPWELTEELAREKGLEVDIIGFQEEMEKQRERARSALKKVGMGVSPLSRIREEKGGSLFIGYESLSSRSQVIALLLNGEEVASLKAPAEGEVLLDSTPFYPEKGGQIGDTGRMVWESGEAEVLDTQMPWEDIIVHRVRVKKGELLPEIAVHAEVNSRRRAAIARAHTATHLLHFALRKTLGPHALQSGSLVEPDRLRFDFSHFAPIEDKEIREIETLVNVLIQENHPVQALEMSLEDAKKQGIVAIFGEKYKDQVRAIVTGPSRELCGGTHVERTGDIGYFLIVQETGVGANLRRIEALTGESAVKKAQEDREKLKELAQLLTSQEGQEVIKLKKLLEEKDEEHKKAFLFRDRYLRALSQRLKEGISYPVPHIVSRVDSLDIDALTVLSDYLLGEIGSGIVVLGSVLENKPGVLVRVSEDLIKSGWHAGEIARTLGQFLEGSGGGKPEMGRAGGKKPEGMEKALQKVREIFQGEGSGS